MPYGSLAVDTLTSSTGQVFSPASSIMRNRIINGGMVIDQRNGGGSVTPTGDAYTLDRWTTWTYQASKFSVQQNAGSITPPAGFTNYLGCTSTSAYSVPSGEGFAMMQKIEGYNIADLGWGTIGALSVTLSFWVRSSLTGIFGGALNNSAQNRSYPFSYTINSANTWEYKTITIAGDTSGTWLTTSGAGILLKFGLGVGSTLSGTAGAWANASYSSATGATSVVGTSGATFYITGVQLEAGSVASQFEYRQYGTELNLCQRYYQRQTGGGRHFIAGNGGVNSCYPTAFLVQTLRSTPTFSYSAVGDFVIEGLTGGGQSTCTGLSLNAYTFNSVTINATSSSGTGSTAGQVLGGSSSAWTAFSAEL